MNDESRQSRAGRTFTTRVKYHWTEGEVVEGAIIGVASKAGKRGDSYTLYTIQTDEGVEQMTLSSYMWDTIKQDVYIGDVVRIEFHGKKEIGDDRQVNLFDLTIIEEGAGIVPLASAIQEDK